MVKALFAVLLSGLLFFGCTNLQNQVPTQTNQYSSNPIPSKQSCNDLVKDLIPHYIVYGSSSKSITLKNGEQLPLLDQHGLSIYCIDAIYWGRLKAPCYRGGSRPGENINSLYFTPGEQGLDCLCPVNGFSYSKEIIGSDGTVYGYRNFSVIPTVLRKYNASFSGSRVSDGYKVNWSGADKAILEDGFNTSVLHIIFYYPDAFSSSKDKVVCDLQTNDSSGEYFCNYTTWLIKEFNGYGSLENQLGNVRIDAPDLNDIYEITDVNITQCNWITDSGETIN